MRKVYLLCIVLLPFFAFSQQQLFIKGNHPNFHVTHNVSSNETYASIAKLYNLTALQIATYNDLTLHDGKIFARTLQIPLRAQNFIQRASTLRGEVLVPVDYKLSPNETVKNVLAKFKVSTQMLKQMSNLSDQQLNSTNQFTVGFLLVKPEAASFFGTRKKQTDATKTPETKRVDDIEKKDTALTDVKKEAIVTDTTTKQRDTSAVTSSITTPSENLFQKAISLKNNRLKVFVDCSNTWCDRNFIKTEINIVDFLLDRVASDVHMLITSQRNGNGGSQIQMIFYGQNRFKNTKDTLRFNIDPNATDNERREAMLTYMKLGLTPFIAKTDFAGDINIQMKKDLQSSDASSNADTKDKWNYWVFNTGASGSISLNEVYKSRYYSGSLSANRTTDKLKVGLNMYGDRNTDSYEYADTSRPSGFSEDIIQNTSYTVSHFLIKSISGHWSIGYEASYSSSTFSNNKQRLYFRPAVEYAIFPYKEVNNKFWTINYGVDVRQNKYYDTTIYGKTEEILYGHVLSTNLSVNQKWGNINSSLTYRNYLSNWERNNLIMNISINVRITGGLSVYGYTEAGLIRDQIYLSGEQLDPRDILTRRRQVASNYTFSSSFGFSYRFGSKLNNFVNPRFDTR
jgi:hypothetical protein